MQELERFAPVEFVSAVEPFNATILKQQVMSIRNCLG